MSLRPRRDPRPHHDSPTDGEGISRRAWARAAVLGVALPAGLSGCGVHFESDDHPPREDEDPRTALRLVQSGARYAMRTSLAHGSRTRWVTEGLQEQVLHLRGITGAVTIDPEKVLQPRVNGDVARALLASADAMLPRLHEAGDDLGLASDMVAWWIGASHVIDPRGALPSVPNDAAAQAATTIEGLHEVTWAMQVLTTRLAADARKRSLRNIGHLQDIRRVVDNLAGTAGPEQEVAYQMPREVMDRENRADRFMHFLDAWSAELRGQIRENADDAKQLHLLTSLLGTATGLQMDWNEHTTPAVPATDDSAGD